MTELTIIYLGLRRFVEGKRQHFLTCSYLPVPRLGWLTNLHKGAPAEVWPAVRVPANYTQMTQNSICNSKTLLTPNRRNVNRGASEHPPILNAAAEVPRSSFLALRGVTQEVNLVQ